MENQNQLPEEELDSIITLTDENGEEMAFEYLDLVEYEGKEYLVLTPAEEETGDIIILEIEPVDEENENYLTILDEELLNTVYELFKERNKEYLEFAD
jgi:uncharacterized protein YrzB (UPF0473 family)